MPKSFDRALAGLALALLGGLASAQTISPILPSGGSFVGTLPVGVSGDGQVVLGGQLWANDSGFRWTASGGTSVLPFFSGYQSNSLRGSNADGSIVALNALAPASSFGRGGKWTSSGGFQTFGLLPGGTWQEVLGVSADGQTFVGRAGIASGATRAYRWTQATGLLNLGVLGTGYNSHALAATPNGSTIVGWSEVTNGGASMPFRWTAVGGLQQIPVPAGNVGSHLPAAISDDGRVIAYYGGNPGTYTHTYRWTDLGGGTYSIDDVGTLIPNGSIYPRALARDGSVVFGNATTVIGSSQTGYLWAPDLGLRDIATWLPSVGFNMSGWSQITDVVGVSDDGRVITGRGKWNGQDLGFVARNVPCLHLPVATSNPIPRTICTGTTASFSTSTGGNYTGTCTFRWERNGVPMNNGTQPGGSIASGVTTTTLTLGNCTISDNADYTCVISNPCGSTTTSLATLTVVVPGVISAQPADTTICPGSSGAIGVTTTHTRADSPRFAWNRVTISRGGSHILTPLSDGFTASGTFLSGVSTPTLSFTSMQPGDAGRYVCTITGVCNSLITREAFVTVPAGSPTITTQPLDVTSCPAGPAQFNVAAAPADGPFTYQWQRLGGHNHWFNLVDGPTPGCALQSGCLTDTLTLVGNPTLNPLTENGFYRCIVTNACGSSISMPAMLTICPGDFNCDGGVDQSDVNDFFFYWSNGDQSADLNCDGGVDQGDVSDFYTAWANGC